MNREYVYNELKESKLIYDRRPPIFGVIITFVTLVFIISAIFWAGFSPKTYVIRASGLVVSEDKVNVMNKVSGSIKEINISEGQSVESGDVLFVFDSFQTELQVAQLQAMVDFYQSKISIMERLINFINEFTLSEPNARKNPFINTNLDEAKAYADAQTFIDYIDGQEVGAQNEEPPRVYTQNEADSLKSQFLSQQYGTLNEYQTQLIQQQSQLTMYKDSLAEYMVIAEQTGIIHLTSGITIGTVIQAGSLLGNISSDDKDGLYFDTVISATDRAKLHIGDITETAVAGAVQSEFGVIIGKVVHIDNDSTQTENGEIFFRIKIKPDKTFLEDKKGNKIVLSTGMIGESRIKYDETTWLRWIIEQIGIKFK